MMLERICILSYFLIAIFTYGHFVASNYCNWQYPDGSDRREMCVIIFGPIVSGA